MCLAMLLGSILAVYGRPRLGDTNTTLGDAVEELRRVYATDIVLGKPLEIEGLKIIPLATVGMGYAQKGSPDRVTTQGAGGVVSPVGVIVVSPRGVQLLPVSKGFVEQLLSAVTPLVLHMIRGESQKARNVSSDDQSRFPLPVILARLYALLPENGLRFGWFPWPFGLVLIFVAGWLALAVLIGVFLPQPVTAIATVLRAHTLRTGIVGVLSYGVVFILVAVFTVSIIGIPLAIMVLVLIWALQLLGMVSIAALVGQRIVTAMRRPTYSPGATILIGSIILGIVRIIPVLGWVVWLVLGIFGLGAVLLMQRRTVQREGLERTGE